MASLLDYLRPQQAQQPGAMQQQGLFGQLLNPSVALPMAGALLGNQGNAANFGNAFSAAGPALAQQKLEAQTNKTGDWLRQQDQRYGDMLDNGFQPREVYDLYLQERKAQTAQTPFQARAAAAQQYGLDPNSPEGRRFILAGDLSGGSNANLPTSIQEFERAQNDPEFKKWMTTGKGRDSSLMAGDRQAVREAEDAAQASQNTIDMLGSVLNESNGPGTSLNDRAGYGASATKQAWLARNDPTGFFDDAKGEATTELSNVVLGQALSSLKAIFGAAPTEGERKILVDLQASVDKTPNERRLIIQRAIDLAKRRQAFNMDRANELRGGTYYQPGGGYNPQGGGNGADPLGIR